MPDKKQQNTSFVICHICEGSGKKDGIICPNCAGLGVGAFLNGYFLYWGLNLSRPAVRLRQLAGRADLFVNFIAFIIALIGFAALGFWIWQQEFLTYFNFVNYKNPLIFLFWLGVSAVMFIFYRISEDADRMARIPKGIARKNNLTTPDNWKELKKYKYKIEVSSGFDHGALKTLEESVELARKMRHNGADTIHLFFNSLKDGVVGAMFGRLSVPGNELVEKVKRQLLNPSSANQEIISLELKEVLIEAYIQAARSNQKKVEVNNFIMPAQMYDANVREILYDLEIDEDKILNAIKWFRINDEIIENYRKYRKMAKYKPGSNMDRAYTAVATEVLNQLSYDLTREAKWGRLEICVAREDEIEDIFQKFESGRAGVILVGDPGAGKNTIVGGIAQAMVREDVPNILKDKRLVELDVARLVSGADPSEAQQRLLVIMDEISRSGNIVLYIKNIENIVGIQAGVGESLDLSEVLVSALERSSFYCIASTTISNYSKYIENKPIGELMARIEIREPEKNRAIQMLESKIGFLENKHSIFFSYNALEEAVKLSSKYIHDKRLPAKAIEILESAATKALDEKGKEGLIVKDDIAGIVSEMTNIPLDKVSEHEEDVLLNLEASMHKRMIGQEEAVKMVSASLRRARVEMRDSKRPIASFLFLGPTGVGKTELAKTVAEVYFGDEKAMVRLDMSEYQEQSSIKKMLGEGDEPGYLTEAVRKAPFSLVLLDEFEKAHPEILNLFLQIMDDGRLTDGQGRTIDFTNCIIIATSNAGALYIQDQVKSGADAGRIKEVLINEQLNKVMKPELINRFDGIVVFGPLSEDDILSIAKLMLKKIERMLELKGIGLLAEEDGVRKLAREGFDPKFGARPLRRVLQERIENAIANLILSD
ncbi:MAG: ATP-dependent Clp protease ATP-binding subunit, partial [Patescibacteria group bacterium]